jgi:hypothetical protein
MACRRRSIFIHVVCSANTVSVDKTYTNRLRGYRQTSASVVCRTEGSRLVMIMVLSIHILCRSSETIIAERHISQMGDIVSARA